MEKSSTATLECEDIKTRLQNDDEDSIPLADDDVSASVLDEENSSENRVSKWRKGHESLDSIPSMISDSLPVSGGPSSLIGLTASHVSEQMTRMCLDPDFSPDEVEEKARLISQVLELQNTLDDLTNRVDAVKEENLKLRSENTVLGQYIENLMQASAVFQAVSPKTGRKEQGTSSYSSEQRGACGGGGGAGNNLGSVIRCTTRAVRGAQGTSNHS